MNDDAQALAVQYQAALQLENWPAAEQALKTLIARKGPNPALLFNLGLVLKRQDKLAEAIPVLRSALSLADGHHNARFELATALFDSGALGEAREEFSKYVRSVPDDTAGLLNCGLVLLRSGMPREAQQMLRRAHVEDQSASVTLALAEAECDCGMLQEAVATLRSLVASEPQAREASIAILLKAMLQTQRGDAAALLDEKATD